MSTEGQFDPDVVFENSSGSDSRIVIGEPSNGSNLGSEKSILFHYNYYRKLNEDGKQFAVCLKCEELNEKNKNFKGYIAKNPKFSNKGGSTTGLHTHIRTHPELREKYFAQIEQQTKQRKEEKISTSKHVQTFFSNNKKTLSIHIPTDPELQKRWDEALVMYLSETFVSFRSTEKLKILLHAIWPNSKNLKLEVRSHQTVSNQVEKVSASVVDGMYTVVNDAKKSTIGFAVTTDLWRNKSLLTFMSCSIHFITKDFVLVRLVPFVEYFDYDKHTGRNIKMKLEKFFEALGIDDEDIMKVVVADRASNNRLMIKLSPELSPVWCNIHALQLGVTDCFKLSVGSVGITDLIKNCQELAKFVTRSEARKRELERACLQVGIKFRLPQKQNTTRWNSTEANLASIVHLKEGLQYCVIKDSEDVWLEHVLTGQEFDVAAGLLKVLQVPKQMTKSWEADLTPTLHLVITELYNAKDMLLKLSEDAEENQHVRVFALKMVESLEKRFPCCGTEVMFHNIAHFLDPKMKGIVLQEFPGVYNKTRSEIVKLGKGLEQEGFVNQSNIENNDNDTVNLNQYSGAERLLQMKRIRLTGSAEPNMRLSKVEIELQKFEGMETSQWTDPLAFYKENCECLPIISKIVRFVLAIPASSATSERAFSVGTQICTARRMHMKPEKVEDLTIIKINKKIVDDYLKKYSIPLLTMPDRVSVEFETEVRVEESDSDGEGLDEDFEDTFFSD